MGGIMIYEFVCWKALSDQSHGWNPDLGDGVCFLSACPFVLMGFTSSAERTRKQ